VLSAAFVCVLAAVAVTVVPAVAERIQLGKMILVVDGGFKPKTLPQHEFAPISLQGEGHISTTDGSLPPAVRSVDIDWDRNGLLTTRGLPVCQPGKLENTTTPMAMKACRSALVGKGFASGMVAFPDDPPFGASSTVLAFNGPRRGGKWTLLFHAYAYVPAPTTFVVPVIISKTNEGRYGYNSHVDAPTIAGGYGVVTDFDLKVYRRWKQKGENLSYISARCADGRLQARGEVEFVDDTVMSAHVFRPCTPRKYPTQPIGPSGDCRVKLRAPRRSVRARDGGYRQHVPRRTRGRRRREDSASEAPDRSR
jgi:hypothetical protein